MTMAVSWRALAALQAAIPIGTFNRFYMYAPVNRSPSAAGSRVVCRGWMVDGGEPRTYTCRSNREAGKAQTPGCDSWEAPEHLTVHTRGGQKIQKWRLFTRVREATRVAEREREGHWRGSGRCDSISHRIIDRVSSPTALPTSPHGSRVCALQQGPSRPQCFQVPVRTETENTANTPSYSRRG
jgi:hypothetical protein